jgi:hypothetical protein
MLVVKMHCKSHLIKKLLLKLVSEENEKKKHVKEARDMIVTTWWPVNGSTIIKYWGKASIVTNNDLEVDTTATERESTGMEVEREIGERREFGHS